MYSAEHNLIGHRDGDCHIDADGNFIAGKPNAVWEFKTINADGFARLMLSR